MDKMTGPLVGADYFFDAQNGVHIHRSSECTEYVGVFSQAYICGNRLYHLRQGQHILENNTYWVSKGDVVVINPNEAHAFMEDKTCEEAFPAYDLMFTPEFIDRQCLQGDDFSALADLPVSREPGGFFQTVSDPPVRL